MTGDAHCATDDVPRLFQTTMGRIALKNQNPAGRNLRFANTGQRLFALALLAVFAGLIWLAWSGRFDAEINRISAWMQASYRALTD